MSVRGTAPSVAFFEGRSLGEGLSERGLKKSESESDLSFKIKNPVFLSVLQPVNDQYPCFTSTGVIESTFAVGDMVL